MSGKVNQISTTNDSTYLNNLLYAVEKFEKEKIIGVIEPINNITVPDYYMNSFQKGISYRTSVCDNIVMFTNLFI